MIILISEYKRLIINKVWRCGLKVRHAVILTRNGKEAIDTLKEKDVDLAITNAMIPFVSGI